MSDKNVIAKLNSFKVVLMGESGVGKTSIINRYINDKFENNMLATAGVGFFTKILEFPEMQKTCKLDVKKFYNI